MALQLPNLRQPKTLLLLGGAFGIVALAIWLGCKYRIVIDRSGSAPATAVISVTLTGKLPIKVSEALPRDLSEALNSGGAYSDLSATGTLSWHPLDQRGHWKIAPRNAGAIGFLRSEGVVLPLLVIFNQKNLIARVGYGLTGISLKNIPEQPRLIKAFPKDSVLYISKYGQADTSLKQAFGPVGSTLKAIYDILPGRTEMVSAFRSGDALQPFILVMAPSQTPTDFNKLDNEISNVVGHLDPTNKEVSLPDNSISNEIRSSSSKVLITRREISSGTIVKFVGQSIGTGMWYYRDNDGSLWISNHNEIIQQFYASGSDNSLEFEGCSSQNDIFTAVTHTKAASAVNTQPQWIRNWGGGFDTVIFSLIQKETGLFTVCGYLD